MISSLGVTDLTVVRSSIAVLGITQEGGGAPGVPVNVSPPVVTGIGQIGMTLATSNGAWSGSPTSFSYQWYRNGISISGQTAPTYVTVSADEAKTVSSVVTASNSSGATPSSSFMPAFGLYASTLGGSVQNLLLSSAGHETNHAKQSASLNLVAATIYTLGTPSEEGASSLGTGIILLNPSSLVVTTAVTPNALQNNSNPVWNTAGTAFVYSSTNVSSGKVGGRQYVIAGGVDTEYYAPTDINVSDFSLDASNNLLMSGYGSSVLGGRGSALFVRAGDTGTRYQLTAPVITGSGNPLGDFDPSWSPDGTMAACVRATAVAGVFSICIVTVGPESGSPPFNNLGEFLIAPIGSAASFWGVPSWSSDEVKIISALYDPDNLALNGVYEMNPDGTGITRIALRAEEYYNTPRFVPGGGSSSSAKILYATRFIPIFSTGAPGVLTLPTISGVASVNQLLTGTQGTWTNGPTSFAYQWNRSGTPIIGANALTYTPVVADVGDTLTLTVTAFNIDGFTTATSLPTAAVTVVQNSSAYIVLLAA